MEFKDKVILITGASSGIGFAITEKLAKENCKLFLLARRIEILDKLSEDLKNESSQIFTIKCDVTDKYDIQKSVAIIMEKFGKIDLALLNAGASSRSNVAETDSGEAEQVFAVNVMGIIYFVEELIPIFKRQQNGIVAGVTSLAEKRGFPKSGFYCASKAAASIFLESLRVELKEFGIKVITIKPGFVKTPMTEKNKFEMPMLMQPEKAAEIILRGIRKEKKIIEFPLTIALASKLLKFIPNFLFDYLSKKTK